MQPVTIDVNCPSLRSFGRFRLVLRDFWYVFNFDLRSLWSSSCEQLVLDCINASKQADSLSHSLNSRKACLCLDTDRRSCTLHHRCQEMRNASDDEPPLVVVEVHPWRVYDQHFGVVNQRARKVDQLAIRARHRSRPSRSRSANTRSN